MIAFASIVDSPEHFERYALAGIRRSAEADSPVAELTEAQSVAGAYNEILDAFVAHDDLEALVLVDEHTEILDPAFCARIRGFLADGDDIAVLESEHGVLVLSPWAVRELRVSTASPAGQEAVAAELVAKARDAGRRVVDAPLDVRRHGAAASRPHAAGAKDGIDAAPQQYFEHTRPELVALVPESATRVLDVGCGTGALGWTLKQRGTAEVCGIEVVPDAAAVARTRLDAVVEADLEALGDLPFADEHFDAIVFGDVLEHIRDPAGLLTALKRYLRPGGHIVCSIPNVKHWSVLLPLLIDDRFEYTDAGLLDRTHLHLFTLVEIKLMLDACGFELEELGANRIAVPEQWERLTRSLVISAADPAEQYRRMEVYQYLLRAQRT